MPFIAEIWKNEFTHAVIDKQYEIKLNDIIIHIEPIEKEKISGYFLFQFINDENSVNSAEAFAEQIKQKEFEDFNRILLLKGLNLEVTWNKIETVDFPKGKNLHTLKLCSIKYKTLDWPISFSNEDIKSIEKIYNKIQQHQKKIHINNILNLLTMHSSNEMENFFYKWVSFNQIYSYDRPDTEFERMSIEQFANRYSTFPESNQQIEQCASVFSLLCEVDHFNKQGTENFSLGLMQSLNDVNNSEIWRYAFLCVYSIRNEFFHKGQEHTEFGKISSFISDVVVTSLNNIFRLK